MTRNQISIKYDTFFGAGLWERDYKPHITVFAEQCVRESEKENPWNSCEQVLPEIGDRILAETTVGNIYYGIYSDEDEFDLHIPTNEDYRSKWFKYSTRTVIKWQLLKSS